MAFFFDEAVEHILSFRGKREIEKKGKSYIEEYWIKEPKWSDLEEVAEVNKKNRPSNNNDLLTEMKKELEKYK